MLRRLRPFFMISDTKSHSSRTPPCFCHFFRYTITQQVGCTGALHIFRKGGYCNMAVIHTEQFLEQIQSSYHFTDLEMKRLKYTLKAISSELVKTLALSVLFFKLGHLPEFIIGVFILITIRCNSGGLHMEHFVTCLLFTLIFMLLSVILLPAFVPVPYPARPFLLALCILATFLTAPVASKKKAPSRTRGQTPVPQQGNCVIIPIFYCCSYFENNSNRRYLLLDYCFTDTTTNLCRCRTERRKQ